MPALIEWMHNRHGSETWSINCDVICAKTYLKKKKATHLAPLGEYIDVFIPIKFPALFSSGPPEFPGLMDASNVVCSRGWVPCWSSNNEYCDSNYFLPVWMTLVIGLPIGLLTSLPIPLTTPTVSVWSSPNGFPIAYADNHQKYEICSSAGEKHCACTKLCVKEKGILR